jgi:hypothetical protein
LWRWLSTEPFPLYGDTRLLVTFKASHDAYFEK